MAPLGVLHQGRRSVVAFGAGSGIAFELVARSLGPHPGGRGLQVGLEVGRAAGVVAAVDDVDVLGRHGRVERGDRRVVPAGDAAVEDPGNRLRVEHQEVDGQVVGDGQRAEYHRQIPGRRAPASLRGFIGLVVTERRVRSGEITLTRKEITDSVARTVCRVVERVPGAGLAVGADESLHRVGLCGRPAGGYRRLATAVHDHAGVGRVGVWDLASR